MSHKMFRQVNKSSEIVARNVGSCACDVVACLRHFIYFDRLSFHFIVDLKCLKVQRAHRFSTSNLPGEVTAQCATTRPASI